jgi:hypothetical protein
MTILVVWSSLEHSKNNSKGDIVPNYVIRWLRWFVRSHGNAFFFNLKTKEIVFALFVGIIRSCWVGGKGNYNQVSFANIDAKSTFSIILYDSKNFKEYKNKILKWSQYWA